ncbi:hypothetical protein [Lysinibacillus sp. 54212]|uniref:hypothetical protein n=1 Tax=Lysinibacillus sp. 54212 TaxID=3119829 RepID=UPI002FC7353A
MKNLILFSLLLINVLLLVACEEKKEEVTTNEELIINIEPFDKSGFLETPYYIVETDVQTYTVHEPIYENAVINNDATEDKMITIDGERRSDIKLHLTSETYKKLSKEYAEVTGATLRKDGLSLEKYIEENY